MPEPLPVFISWSGRRSKALAEALRRWLPQVLDSDRFDQPFLSSDIDKGRLWFDEVFGQLNKCRAAVVCVTPENLGSPWMHFEAGAIAKTLALQPETASMFTYLHGLGASELSGPLAQYQATLTTRADTALLVAALANLSGSEAAGAMTRFEELWPKLEDAIESIAPQTPAEVLPLLESRFRRKTFREPLADCMNQTWTDRHASAREVLAELRADEPLVEQRCRPFHVELFRELIAELDGYAMAMSALLVGCKPPFPLGEEGRLEIDAGIAAACESRRERIHAILSQLMDPDGAPACDESLRFLNASSLDARRSVLHRKKHEMRGWTKSQRDRAGHADRRNSRWEFDRIIAYVLQLPGDLRKDLPHWPARDLLSAADGEINRAYSEGASRPPMALYYALRALEESLGEPDAEISQSVTSLVARLDDPQAAKLIENHDEFRFSDVISALRQHGTPSHVRVSQANDLHAPHTGSTATAPVQQ